MYLYDENPAEKICDPRKTDTHFITHLRWNRSNEIGICSVKDGAVQNDFQLVQHGWPDFKKAEEVIIRQLAKGHDISRICKFMDMARDTRRIYLKAKTCTTTQHQPTKGERDE